MNSDDAAKNAIHGGGITSDIVSHAAKNAIRGGGITSDIVSHAAKNAIRGGRITSDIVSHAAKNAIHGGGITSDIVSHAGKISVIHGPMFSGKTEELLRRVRRAKIARKKVQLFKPAIDNRYHATRVLPHFLAGGGAERTQGSTDESVTVGEEAQIVQHPRDILGFMKPDTDIVAIEEAQFLDGALFDIVRRFAREGVDVILSLLDQDYRKLPFPISGSNRTVGDYLAIAHESLKLAAICVVCGADAHHSQKLVLHNINPQGRPEYQPASFYSEVVTVGTSQEIAQNTLFAEKKAEFPENIYEARCRNCHIVLDEP